MYFEHIQILWFLGVIPLIVGLFILQQYRRKKSLDSFANKAMIGRLTPDASRRRPIIKLTLICLATGFLIVALANPRAGATIAEGEHSGIDIAVCIDVSNSMLAQDMKPDRMERSKQVVLNLLGQLGGDRVSFVVFAGSAFIQMPLTNDYSATKMFLDQINTELISEQGTAIGDAIDKGMATLGYSDDGSDDSPQWEPNKSRAIIIISDGENHEDDAVEAAKQAAKQGIMVCTIGIGSPNGSQIPIVDGHGNTTGWRKDNEGQVITTRLNEQMLEDIAKAGNGVYANASSGAVEKVIKQLDTLDKQKFGASKYSSFKTQYMYPLAAALLLLIIELFFLERRNPHINIGKLIKRKEV